MKRLFRPLRQESVQPLWDDWELDEEFFRTLSRYSEQHPNDNNKLSGVINTINNGLEAFKYFYDLIPDNPFPARSLVTALGCLIQLGIKVTRAKKNTYEFAIQVANWVEDVKMAIEGHGSGHYFTWMTRWSLRNVRTLINEICLWACARLEDGRWWKIENGLRIGKEIDDFKKRLSESKELFRDLSLIHLTGGMQRLNRSIYSLTDGMKTLVGCIQLVLRIMASILLGQDAILKEMRKIKQQQRDQLAYIISEMDAAKQAEVRRSYFALTLNRHVVANPTYDEQDKRPCDEGTRVAELSNIKKWLHSISPGSQNFLWLTGQPGCGKSAVTASLVEHCLNEKIPLAQFFINRNNKETTDPHSYFPTIARQLANMSTEVEQAVYDKLKQKPTLASRISSEQAAKLFVDTLAVAANLDKNQIVAVIIDAFDETERQHLRAAAVIFSHLFKTLSRYPNVKVLISSRTEDDIRNPFAQNMRDVNVKHIHLDTEESVEDVASYLRKRLQKMVEYHDLNWEVWPREDRMSLLCVRADGLFIWAVTVARYIEDRLEDDGRGCLDDVLDELTGEALDGINTLYTLILLSSQKKRLLTEWDFEKFRRIIGAIVVLREPMCLDDLSRLLNLRQGPANIPADIVHFVRRLRTLLVDGADVIDGKTIPRLHKSFFEFITDPKSFKQLSLDVRFCIDPFVAEAELALCCLELSATCGSEGDQSSSLPGSLSYASQFCSSHTEVVLGQSSGLILLDRTGNVDDIRSLLSNVQLNGFSSPRFSTGWLFSQLNEAYQMVIDNGPNLIKRLLGTAPSRVRCLAYSPNGEQLISGLNDNSLLLWDVQTGREVSTFQGHTNDVWTVAFSSDGNRIASGSIDYTVRIWDLQTQETEHVLRGHAAFVRFVRFSPDGSILASASNDQSLRFWDVQSGKAVAPTIKHVDGVSGLCFTPDESRVISITKGSRLVHVWDRRTGKHLQGLTSFLSRVDSVAISPFGDYLAAIGSGGVCFWHQSLDGFIFDDALSFKLCHIPERSSFRIAFFPSGKSVVLWYNVDNYASFLVYDLRYRVAVPFPFTPEITAFVISPNDSSFTFSTGRDIHIWTVPRVTFTALSPNGDIVVCAFSDGTVWFSIPQELPIVKKRLEGKVGNLKFVAFPSDNSLLAAIDDESLYLWGVSTLKLRARGFLRTLAPVTSLSFLLDRSTLVSFHSDKTVLYWDAMDGNLHPRHPNISDIALDSPLSLDVDELHMREVAGARWFPAKKKASDFLAYIDGCLIRRRVADGSVILLPMKES